MQYQALALSRVIAVSRHPIAVYARGTIIAPREESIIVVARLHRIIDVIANVERLLEVVTVTA